MLARRSFFRPRQRENTGRWPEARFSQSFQLCAIARTVGHLTRSKCDDPVPELARVRENHVGDHDSGLFRARITSAPALSASSSFLIPSHVSDEKRTINQQLRGGSGHRFDRANEEADKAIGCRIAGWYNDRLFYKRSRAKHVESRRATEQRDRRAEVPLVPGRAICF